MSQAMLDRLDRVDVETAQDGMLIELPHAPRLSAAPTPRAPRTRRQPRSASL